MEEKIVGRSLIEQKQDQKLIMTQAMQRAFLVLQMPASELIDWLEKEIEQNPLFEVFPHSYPYPTLPYSANQEELNDYKQSLIQPEKTLYSHLLSEVHSHFEDPQEKMIAKYLAGLVDEKGFLSFDYQEICANLKIDQHILDNVVTTFKQMEPIGVGAKDAKEALLLQLKAAKKEKTLAYRIMDEFYQEFIHNQLPIIAKFLHISIHRLRHIIRSDIQPLQPFPGLPFRQDKNQSIIPDIYIEKEGNRWKIRLHEEELPSFRIQPFYLEQLRNSHLSQEEVSFIRRHLASGKWLLRTLDRRKKTLQDIALYLIKTQRPFLEGISSSPAPMTMQEIAHSLDLNESTITRAIVNKYISCPRGVVKMRDFFTQAIETTSGKVSNQTAKNLLFTLIKQEDKRRPLSDQTLSTYLIDRGIPCARRTITKYRKLMKIPAARERKVWS
jgi:RNA polymerase sigma-54 factor